MSRDIRDISPLLQKLRNFLLGRKHITALRYQDDIATRSPPLPNLPDGPSHGLHSNYYYSRDARREVKPPTVVAEGVPQLGTGCESVAPKEKSLTMRTPGNVFHWD